MRAHIERRYGVEFSPPGPRLRDYVTAVKQIFRSFRTGELQTVHNPSTIADGARTSSLGSLTFPIVLHRVAEMTTVSDVELLRTMFFLFERVNPPIRLSPGARSLIGRFLLLMKHGLDYILSKIKSNINFIERGAIA